MSGILREKATYDNIFGTSGKNQQKPVIQGHRGGFLPENSMETFTKAKESGITSIEIDVWLTTDEHFVVYHGGANGEFYQRKESEGPDASVKKFAFQSTLEECLQAEQEIPLSTLNALFNLAKDQLFVNIEVKCPYDPEIKKLYNWKLTALRLFELIKQYDFQENCYVSSFHEDFLDEFISLTEKNEYHVRTVLIGTFGEDIKPPSKEFLTSMKHVGYNVRYSQVSQELVDTMNEAGKVLGVWFIAAILIEDKAEFKRLLDLGVHMICTDYPLKAIEVLESEFQQE